MVELLYQVEGLGDDFLCRVVGAGLVTVGGGRLGGYVRADEIFGFLNEGAARCDCSRPYGTSGPLMR